MFEENGEDVSEVGGGKLYEILMKKIRSARGCSEEGRTGEITHKMLLEGIYINEWNREKDAVDTLQKVLRIVDDVDERLDIGVYETGRVFTMWACVIKV